MKLLIIILLVLFTVTLNAAVGDGAVGGSDVVVCFETADGTLVCVVENPSGG